MANALKYLTAVMLLAVVALGQARERKLPKPGWNMFKKDQDIQLGQEYAKQVEQQYYVVPNQDLTAYINRIGRRLVEKGGLEGYPFSFKVVQDDSINAFALPGGPMFVHTGLIKAADNEAQIAGVLAHELSHVMLRHGTNQASKAQLAQIGAMLGGAMAGSSLTGQLAQMGIGLGANSVLMRFSRSAESDADLMGAHIMAKAGYNPVEMARFFEKLESQSRGGAGQKLVEFFTASHPNPGNRVKAIEDQLPYMPRSDYNTQEGELVKMQAIVAKLPPAPKRGAGQGSGTPASPASRPAALQVSPRTKAYAGRGYVLSYPDNWQVRETQESVYVLPAEGVVGNAIAYGVIIGSTPARSGRVNLASDTRSLLQAIASQNANVKQLDASRALNVGGSSALATRLASDSPYAGVREVDLIVTVDRQTALFSVICVAPEPDSVKLEPIYNQILQSIQFK